MFTKTFWKDTAERAVRNAATSFVSTVGATAILWELNWQVIVGIPATAAILEIAVALSGNKVGQKGTASLTD
jgi:hypothetical protein